MAILVPFPTSLGQDKPSTDVVEIWTPDPPVDDCQSGCWTNDPPYPGPDPPIGPPPPFAPCSPPCYHLPVVIEIDPECPSPPLHLCPPGSARARATLIGCGNEVIDSQEYASHESVGCVFGSSHECPDAQTPLGNTCVTFNFVFDVCGKVPKRVKVETFGTEPHANGGVCDVIQVAGPTIIYDVPPPEWGCESTPTDLSCLACSPTIEPSKGRAALFKGRRFGEVGTRHVVYSAPIGSDSTAGVGEIVNGVYRIPGKGLLIVEVEGAVGVAGIYGGASANGLGWQVFPTLAGSGRGGSPLEATQCIEWDEAAAQAPDPRFEFNVRTLQGATGSLSITFRWHEWDEERCCLRRQVERLTIDVLPLPCLRDAREPVTAQLRRLSQPSGASWEARIPCCPTCDGDGRVCSPGNLSDWIVVWPQQGTGLVLDGHAKSWRVDGAALRLTAPTTSGLVDVFEEAP